MTASRSCNITSICDGNFTRLYCVLLILTRTVLTYIQQIYSLYFILTAIYPTLHTSILIYSTFFLQYWILPFSTLYIHQCSLLYSTLFFLSLVLLYPNLPDPCSQIPDITLLKLLSHTSSFKPGDQDQETHRLCYNLHQMY